MNGRGGVWDAGWVQESEDTGWGLSGRGRSRNERGRTGLGVREQKRMECERMEEGVVQAVHVREVGYSVGT